MAVDAAARGRSWGRRLVAEAERIGREMGCTRVQLETFTAEGFYEKLGYAVVSRLADYPPGRAFVRMVKPLSAQPAAPHTSK